MKNIKVLLSDPRHDTVGTHSSFVPINIAYIAAFLKHKIKNFNIQIELTTDNEMKWIIPEGPGSPAMTFNRIK